MRIQFTLTSAEAKWVIAKGVKSSKRVQQTRESGKILLKGGATISAVSQELCGYSGPRNLDSVISYTWDTKRGGPSGTNAQEVSAFI